MVTSSGVTLHAWWHLEEYLYHSEKYHCSIVNDKPLSNIRQQLNQSWSLSALAGTGSNISLSASGRWPPVTGTLTRQSSRYIAKVAVQSRWPFFQGSDRGRCYCIVIVLVTSGLTELDTVYATTGLWTVQGTALVSSQRRIVNHGPS